MISFDLFFGGNTLILLAFMLISLRCTHIVQKCLIWIGMMCKYETLTLCQPSRARLIGLVD